MSYESQPNGKLSPEAAIAHVNRVLACPIDFSKSVDVLRLEQLRYLSTQYDRIARFKLPEGVTIENIAVGTLGRLVFEYLAASSRRATQPWYHTRKLQKPAAHAK